MQESCNCLCWVLYLVWLHLLLCNRPLLLQSSPQKNIIRSCQAQHRQGPHSNNPQNSSSCPATWSPGYGLLDHKALLKAPAAPAGTRPVAAARRLILTSKQSSTKVILAA